MSFARLFCSNCATELIKVFDSQEYGDIDFNLMSEREKDVLQQKFSMLDEVIEHLAEEKKRRILELRDTTDDLLVYYCQVCRIIYDPDRLTRQEIDHTNSGLMPFKKFKKHQVVSDDIESLADATIERSEKGRSEVYLPSQHLVEAHTKLIHPKKLETKFLRHEKGTATGAGVGQIKHAANHVQGIIEKFGSKNVKVRVEESPHNND